MLDSVSDCGGRAQSPCLSCTFHSEGIDEGRHLYTLRYNVRDLAGGREQIIHIGSCQELAVLVIENTFVQAIADAVRHTSMDLTINDHGVDHLPAVMNDHITENPGKTCLRIDLHNRNVSTVCVGRLPRTEVMGGL
jgi:hypothetical protein